MVKVCSSVIPFVSVSWVTEILPSTHRFLGRPESGNVPSVSHPAPIRPRASRFLNKTANADFITQPGNTCLTSLSTNTFVDIDPDVCVSVADNSPLDADPTDREFQLKDLILGRYTVSETLPPPGYAPDPDTKTHELTLANPSNVSNPPVFVNEQLFRVIVITCHHGYRER